METYGCGRKTATLFRIPGFCARSLLILSVPLSDSLSRQGDFVFGGAGFCPGTAEKMTSPY